MSVPADLPASEWDLDYPGGISALDVNYVRPALASSHLIVEQGRAAFVDTGTTWSVPSLLAGLRRRGLAPDAVDYIFLTHIHLDHAGGAGALARELPNARIAVHPRGYAHLADPTKLIQATKAVYGERNYQRLYGDIVAIPESRLVAVADGQSLELAGRRFEFLHTPGHALHHVVILDHGTRAVFTGDTFGISYRDLDVAGRPFVFPTTSPSQFDPEQLKASIRRIVALAPSAAFLTHYGRIAPVAEIGEVLVRRVDELVAMAREVVTGADRERVLRERIYAWLSDALDEHGYAADATARHRVLDADVELNAQGLLVWLERAARG